MSIDLPYGEESGWAGSVGGAAWSLLLYSRAHDTDSLRRTIANDHRVANDHRARRMTFIVNMLRNSAETGGRDRFTCSCAAWELLIELGQAFGWKPRGAMYLPAAISSRSPPVLRHDYQPGDPKDYKQVEAEDAVAWAVALSEARRSPHLAAMLGARPGPSILSGETSAEQLSSANAPFSTTLDEFIEYAFGGAFVFARANRAE